MRDVTLSIEEAEELAGGALTANAVAPAAAQDVARALTLSDADGVPSHGLSRIPSYVNQLHSGKLDGAALPTHCEISASAVSVNANGGFAYPALNTALQWLCAHVADSGIAVAAIGRSHHCGVAGHPVETLARSGHVGILFANTPKAMAFAGGVRPVLGTNPVAFSCPRLDADPLVVDLSLSVVARGRIKLAADNVEKIPDHWAIDESGAATTDPDAALLGSLLPAGGAKGAALALAVEILAAGLTGGHFSYEASSFFDGEGEPPGVGQLLIAIHPSRFNCDFSDRIEMLFAEMLSDSQVRLPGQRRFDSRRAARKNGITYKSELIREISKISKRN